MLFDTHKSIQDAIDFIASTKGSVHRTYLVTIRGDDHAMGGCGIHPVIEHNKAEIGYILHPSIWGKGYATEIARALIGHAVRDLGFHRVYARADVRNTASWRVMEKAGMQRDGILRRDMIVHGEAVDHYLYSILAEEFYGQNG